MPIQVIIPRNSKVSKLIRNKYTELWQKWRNTNYPNRSYTRANLNANIRNVLSVNGKTFEEHNFKQAAINKWSGRNVLPFAHWYFLVRFQTDLFGNVYAIVEDACYEGDYHNDTMATKPYESKTYKNNQVLRLTETQFMDIVTECITNYLKNVYNGRQY